MYNRYIRNDNGEYRRVPVPENVPPRSEPYAPPPPPPPPPDSGGYHPFSGGGPRYGYDSSHGNGPRNSPPPGDSGRRNGLLSGILKKLNLEHIDTGDLLLILILILLFKDGEDEEMLIALGLLLIL